MDRGFWEKLPRPYFAMAPMADVTDFAYRSIIASRGKPDLFYTEFVSADGLCHPIARERLLVDLKYSELERPILAQIFGSRPEKIEQASRLCAELGFDGVDINMGCPDKAIEKQGAGAGMIKNKEQAVEVIEAAMRGAGGLPVSVKTRLGYTSTDEMDEWLGTLASTGVASITVHLRTRKEMSKVPAHWELASRLAGLGPIVAGNGDVADLADARHKAKQYNLDGIMLGRAIFGNPWLFADVGKPDWSEVFATIIEHANLFQKTFIDEPIAEGKKPYKSFAVMRKFFGAYLAGYPRASEVKLELMKCDNHTAVKKVLLGI